MTLDAQFLQIAKALLGDKGWTDDVAALDKAATPWRGGYRGHTPLIARPDKPDTLAKLVALCGKYGVAVTPQGGNTGLVDGGIPHGEIVVKFDRLKRLRAIDPANASLTVEAGMTLAEVQDLADEAGFFFPLSLASEGEATIGGLISTNAGGTGVLRYGMMRDLLLGVECVLADGSLMNGLSGLRKNNTGYNLTHLLAGAEGTLGLITAATLRLFPKTHTQTLWISCASAADAVQIFADMRGCMGDLVTAFELVGPNALSLVLADQTGLVDPLAAGEADLRILTEISTPSDVDTQAMLENFITQSMDNGALEDAILAKNAGETRQFWAIREGISLAKRRLCLSVNHDISVPISAIPDFVRVCEADLIQEFTGSFVTVFGHIGDGNLHYSVCQRREDLVTTGEGHTDGQMDIITPNAANITSLIYKHVIDFGGSISAEHGVGRLKKDLLWDLRDPTASAAMKAIKTALDPKNILNPGRVI